MTLKLTITKVEENGKEKYILLGMIDAFTSEQVNHLKNEATDTYILMVTSDFPVEAIDEIKAAMVLRYPNIELTPDDNLTKEEFEKIKDELLSKVKEANTEIKNRIQFWLNDTEERIRILQKQRNELRQLAFMFNWESEER